MINRRRTLALLAAAAGSASFPAFASPTPRELRIGYQKGGILIGAKRRGTIEARAKAAGVETVRWIEFPFGPPLMEALGLGSIDFGTAGDTPPIFAQAAGSPIVYAAAVPATGSAVLVPKDSPITDPRQLKGKRVAIAKGSSSHNITVKALRAHGLDFRDITPAYLAPADAAAAFARGSVDAWTIWDPYFALAEANQGARVLVLERDIGAGNSFFVANRSFAEAHPGVVQAALDALAEVAAWAERDREAYAAVLAEETGIPLSVQKTAAARASFGVLPLTPGIVSVQQATADTLHALKLIPRPVRVADALWAPNVPRS